MITEKGEPFSEENTITAVANFVLKNNRSRNKSVTVNLSTSRSVDDIAIRNSAKVFRSPVGEINVVKEMQKNGSVIGGEGSGGVIYPKLHYGRDSIIGIALILSEFADSNKKVSGYKNSLPEYFISKAKLENVKNPGMILKIFEKKYSKNKDVIRLWKNDGLKIEFKNFWVHMRRSNTEPIIRIITEAASKEEAERLQRRFLKY